MQSNFVQTRDLRMHYLQQGAGEPVIFIHGFPETSYEWRHQFAHFAGQYACFAPDLRGFGQTEKPSLRVSRQILAQDIVIFMDALGIEKAAVYGFHTGAMVSAALAVAYPDRIVCAAANGYVILTEKEIQACVETSSRRRGWKKCSIRIRDTNPQRTRLLRSVKAVLRPGCIPERD